MVVHTDGDFHEYRMGFGAWLHRYLVGEALDAHSAAARTFRELGERRAEADSLQNLGDALRSMGHLTNAATALATAVDLFRDLGDRPGEATALHHLAGAQQDAGRLDEAIATHRAALGIFHDFGEYPGVADTYRRLADIAQTRGLRLEAESLYHLSQAFVGMSRLDEAADAFASALALFRETGDHEAADAAAELLTAARNRR